jgi:hypothetical protein
MIYSIVGTGTKEREKAHTALLKFGTVSHHVYSEHVLGLEAFVSATNLFGDRVVVQVLQVMEVTSARDELLRLLPEMKESENTFIIDEPFADANRVKRLEKYSEKVFDAREEKVRGLDPFPLCNAFARRDKKDAWLKWMELRDVETPEAIHGALWWKFLTIWSDARSGRPSKFTVQECEVIGGRLLRSVILAHRGERDLKVELESIVLSI